MRKSLPILIATLLLAIGTQAQRLIQTTDNVCYWTNSDLSEDEVMAIPIGSLQTTYIPVSKISVVVDMATGTRVLRPNDITTISPRTFYNGAAELYASEGMRVYVPVTSPILQQAWGGRRLTELIIEDDHWRLVATPEQADFILEYHFIEEGSDRAYLTFKDRTGNRFLYSRAIPAKEWTAVVTGIKSAEQLYNEFVRDLIFSNDPENWGSGDDTLYLLLGQPVGPFLTASITAGVTSDITFGLSPQLKFSYSLGAYFSLGLGVAYMTHDVRWKPMGAIASSTETPIPYSLNVTGPFTVAVATLPLTLNLRYLLTKDMYLEAAAGYAFPLKSRQYAYRDEVYDAYGNLFYADQTITVKTAAPFFSLGMGYRFGHFDFGLSLQSYPTTQIGTSEIEVYEVDIFEQLTHLDHYSHSNRSAVLFFGIKMAYNLSFVRE